MIKKLRAKLILASFFSLAAVLAVIIGAANLLYYQRSVSSADFLLEMLLDSGGTFPDRPDGGGPAEDMRRPGPDPDTRGLRGLFRGGLMNNREMLFESRYFSVRFGADGGQEFSDISNISAVDGETACTYARTVLSGKELSSGQALSGFYDGYRYRAAERDGGVLVVFLDCQREIMNCRAILLFSITASLLGILAVLLILIPLSGRIVKPFAENYEKQRRFITDAGHELRTPITIINADTDVMAMDTGENEWTADIRVQTKRLSELTDDLIFLAKSEEDLAMVPLIELPFSDLVRETAASFEAPALTSGKSFVLDIAPMITVKGDEKGLRHLVSILMDNAVKYSPEGGSISLTLTGDRKGSRAVLSVKNTTAAPVSDETLNNMFDRFYRADASRNSSAGGYGIGLSIARAVVSQHKGTISASRLVNMPDPGIVVTAKLPLCQV